MTDLHRTTTRLARPVNADRPAAKDRDGTAAPRLPRRRVLAGVLGLAAAAPGRRPAFAQPGAATAFPTRPVTIVVPFPPGGSTDVTARLLAERMAPRLPGAIVIDNRPGAQTVVGAEHVARAQPDGHTLLMASGTTLTINPLVGRNLPYKPEDFAPVILVATLPFALVVRPDLPDTVEGFVAHVRANPGRLNWGHNGRGSFNHIAGAMIEERLGLAWQDVPYRGDAHQMNDLLAGTLDAMVVGGATGLAAARTGRGRILAWTGDRRLPNLPDQPALAETHPGLVAQTWFGLLASARTPPAAVARLNDAAARALAEDAALRDRLLAEGIVAAGGTPADFAAFLCAEAERWTPLLRRLDIRLE